MSSANDVNSKRAGPFEEKVQTWQDGLESGIRGLGKGSWARIVKMARKPSSLEFRQTCIVCGIGMFILGFIGFVMLVLMDNVLPSFFEWLTN
ncbi:MAG: protein translocase SEC61 complex subunit gamma [Candidatus Poseidoniales archaeon]|nr:protein translocase SEC61 complex subunit gamma [Candidatus Poseidoniales archaeon]|tara:strand:- start:9910 stop:10185 length:276 start_codon:yes stop_codon:yes gene_type:complete